MMMSSSRRPSSRAAATGGGSSATTTIVLLSILTSALLCLRLTSASQIPPSLPSEAGGADAQQSQMSSGVGTTTGVPVMATRSLQEEEEIDRNNKWDYDDVDEWWEDKGNGNGNGNNKGGGRWKEDEDEWRDRWEDWNEERDRNNRGGDDDDNTKDPTQHPTAEPTPAPTVEPTNEPTVDPTEEPTKDPTKEPTAMPRPKPTPAPTPEETPEPTEGPTKRPRPKPTPDPTRKITPDPSTEPTKRPRPEPTPDPTRIDTPAPTVEPTKRPRPKPTPQPTPEEESDEDSRDDETPEPTDTPTTRRPSPDPTRFRTPKPSDEPTKRPRPTPTLSPTPKPPKETPSPSHEPTDHLRPQPTPSPTVHPTHHPTMEDDVDEDSDTLEFVGQCYWKKCRRCQGDCDEDSECGDGLVCLQRKGNDQRVFGCRGTPVRDVDYCIRKEDMDETLKPTNEPSLLNTAEPTPSPTDHPVAQPSNINDHSNVLREVENCAEDEPCGACEGDCGSNSDCLGALKCWKRKDHAPGGTDGRLESVPGCLGQGDFKFDYCYDPVKFVPTPRPTRKPVAPTPKPTRKPTPLPPTMPTGSVKLTRVGNNLGKYMLAKCEGDCDSDSDCYPGLQCMKRDGGRLKSVFGCKSEGESGTDYCYDPRDGPPPTPKPSRKPTYRPTKPPTLPDAIFIGPTPSPSTPRPSPRPSTPSPISSNIPDSTFSPSSAPVKIVYPITNTGDSFDDGLLASEPTPMPTVESFLDNNEIWINFPAFQLDLTVPRDPDGRRSRRDLHMETGPAPGHRLLIDKTEVQRIVGTLLDSAFREEWESFRGLLIGAREKGTVELTRAKVVSYELSGSALFLRDEGMQVPGVNAVRDAMVDALDTDDLLFDMRQSRDMELQGAQALSLKWDDGSEFVRPASLVDESASDGSGRNRGVGVAAGLAAFVGVVAVGGVLGVYCLRQGRGIFNNQDASSFDRGLGQEEEEVEVEGETPRIGAKRREVVASLPPIVKSYTIPLGTYSDEEAAPNFDGSDVDGSDSQWTVERVGNTNLPEPVVAVPINETAPGSSSLLGNVHAASVLQLDAGDGASRGDFSNVWGRTTAPPPGGREGWMERNETMPAETVGDGASQASSSYHGSSITSGTFSQRSVSLRGFSTQASTQLSEIAESPSPDQRHAAAAVGLAPGETLALSECLPRMK